MMLVVMVHVIMLSRRKQRCITEVVCGIAASQAGAIHWVQGGHVACKGKALHMLTTTHFQPLLKFNP